MPVSIRDSSQCRTFYSNRYSRQQLSFVVFDITFDNSPFHRLCLQFHLFNNNNIIHNFKGQSCAGQTSFHNRIDIRTFNFKIPTFKTTDIIITKHETNSGLSFHLFKNLL